MNPGTPPLPAWPVPHPSFRCGVTSYVYPADLLPNVRALAPAVDDIQLLLTDSSTPDYIPTPDTVQELRAIADAHDLTYTVHLPIDKALGSPDPSERQALQDYILRLLDRCRPLHPHSWLLHLDGIDPDATPDRVRQWQADIMPLLPPLLAAVEDPRRLCLENIGYPFDWCGPFLEAFPFGVCLDAGHFWQLGYDWRAAVRRHLPRTRVIHLYGADTTTRHYALTRSPAPLVREFLQAVRGFNGVLTLETFGYDDTKASIERLNECLKS